MIINFSPKPTPPKDEFDIDEIISGRGWLSRKNESDASHWKTILRKLKEEFLEDTEYGAEKKYDNYFYAWLEDTWKIKVILTTTADFAGYISGIDVDETNYTMLLLRFPR